MPPSTQIQAKELSSLFSNDPLLCDHVKTTTRSKEVAIILSILSINEHLSKNTSESLEIAKTLVSLSPKVAKEEDRSKNIKEIFYRLSQQRAMKEQLNLSPKMREAFSAVFNPNVEKDLLELAISSCFHKKDPEDLSRAFQNLKELFNAQDPSPKPIEESKQNALALRIRYSMNSPSKIKAAKSDEIFEGQRAGIDSISDMFSSLFIFFEKIMHKEAANEEIIRSIAHAVESLVLNKPERVVERYLRGEAITIFTSSKDHMCSLVIQEKLLLKCNKGFGAKRENSNSVQGIEFFKIQNPKNLLRTLEKLSKLEYQVHGKWQLFFEEEINRELGLKKTAFLATSKQNGERCSWTCCCLSIRALLFLDEFKNCKTKKTSLEDLIERSTETYKAWKLFDRQSALEKLAKKNPTLTLELCYEILKEYKTHKTKAKADRIYFTLRDSLPPLLKPCFERDPKFKVYALNTKTSNPDQTQEQRSLHVHVPDLLARSRILRHRKPSDIVRSYLYRSQAPV